MNADPFDTVRDSVNEKLRSVKVLHEMYSDHLNGEGGDEWSINEIEKELRNNIQSVDLYLNDLQDTINIVEKNPQKFRNITKDELIKRKQYIQQTSQQMRGIEQQMKTRKQKQLSSKKDTLLSYQDNQEDDYDHNSTSETTGFLSKKGMSSGHSRLEESYIKDNQRFIDEQLQIQDTIKNNQDQQMDKMLQTTARVNQIAIDIGDELDNQKKDLDEMEDHVERTKNLLERTNKKLQNLLKNTSDKWKITIILVLLIVVIGLILVVALVPFR
ncbi:hypothetical protein ABK040_003129 [Willaertia magna]